MLSRSSSTSSCMKALNENDIIRRKLNHYESFENLHPSQSDKCSNRLLTVDNNHFNLPIVSDSKKKPTTTDKDTTDENVNQLRRTLIQDDIENIQERLNDMLIVVTSTNEYFTPKISTEDNHKDDHDLDPATTNKIDSAVHPFFDVLLTTTYENEVMRYLLNLESRFIEENNKLRSSKQLRQSTNTLKPVQGTPTPGCDSVIVITPKVRRQLIDWIISVHDYHRLNAAILCRTIHLIDRILLINDRMTKLDIQLRAVNCFTIACKLESRRVPDSNSLLTLFDPRYNVTQNHLNHGEKQILTQLDFELEYPLSIHFLCYYLRFLPFHFVVYSLSKYIIECVLCEDKLSEQMPGSLLSAAALFLALKFTRQLDQSDIVKRFYRHVPYKPDELEKSTTEIIQLMKCVPRSLHHSNVRAKYKRSEFDRVANYQFTNDLVIPIS